jgi:two-component system chemotaxis response regulator CheB
MGDRIRVLIVDDSALVQEILRSILGLDSELEVVGFAGNGEKALEQTRELRPDIIVMDIDMPGMNGLAATEKIMAYCPTPILILTSMDRAEVAFEAMSKGAVEVVEKPELDDEKCRELASRIKLIAGVNVVTHIGGRRSGTEQFGSGYPEPSAPGERRRARAHRGKVIGIGSSTGGPQVLERILSGLPRGLPASILVVQHIGDGFVPVLTKWLDGSAQIRVKEAEDSELLAPGIAYVAPSNVHLELAHDRIALTDGPPLGGHRPSVDVLLSSVATHYGKRGVAVILSGMGRDGAQGARAIRDAGGYTMAQTEDTCVVFGMPKAAIELDGVDRVLNPEEIALEIAHQAQEGDES